VTDVFLENTCLCYYLSAFLADVSPASIQRLSSTRSTTNMRYIMKSILQIVRALGMAGRQTCLLGVVVVVAQWPAISAAQQTSTRYVITADDETPNLTNTATFFSIGLGGALTQVATTASGGAGSAGGYFAASRVSVLHNAQADCAFVGNGASNTVGALSVQTQTLVASFFGSGTDTGGTVGVGLATNDIYLYVGFGGSNTIGTFAVEPGCALAFIGDSSVLGLNGGTITGLAARGNILVVTYGDASIESFNISQGMPISNGDAQNSTGSTNDHIPNGVDITSDGHYAIFGDASTVTTVEVSDISSGKLTPTIVYNVGTAWNSASVWLSPDETLLYISNSSGGQVTAAFFDKATGTVTRGCVSQRLNGFYNGWVYAGRVGTALSTGTGSVLYVPEFGGPSSVGIVNVQASNGKCTLTEAPGSPVSDPNSSTLISIGVYPARPF